MTESTGGADVFAELIVEQIDEERLRKTSLEARGLALITASGAFTTLVLGVAALVPQESLPVAARVFLILAFVCFVAAAVQGIWVNRPANYEEPSVESLASAFEEGRDKSVESARRSASKLRLTTLRASRLRNDEKAQALRRGAWAQIVGLGLTAVAGIVALIQA